MVPLGLCLTVVHCDIYRWLLRRAALLWNLLWQLHLPRQTRVDTCENLLMPLM